MDNLPKLFDGLAKRPEVYVHPVTFATVRGYLAGLATGLRFAGVEWSWDDYQAAAVPWGWDPRGNIGILGGLQPQGAVGRGDGSGGDRGRGRCLRAGGRPPARASRTRRCR